MSFDCLAPHYRWMECALAGNKLQRCRTTWLNRVGEANKILIAGEGNGRFLVECRRKFPTAPITVLDASALMLEAARRALVRTGFACKNINFIHSDVLAWAGEARTFDLIVTHFFLDCFPGDQLARIVSKLSHVATPEATWLVADFEIPPCGLRRYRARAIHALMYAFFGIFTKLEARRLTPPDKLLRVSGFVLEATQTSEWGLLRSDLWRRGTNRSLMAHGL